MILMYITLNNYDEARKIGRKILEQHLANCVNFFPITCIYNFENEITEEPETVLIVKTKENKYKEIEKIIKEEIDYTNFIGQIKVEKVNDEFNNWLTNIVF